MRDTIRFVLGGRIHEVRGLAPTTTVLEYLREWLGRTGTKEGCAEGDCGACTVVVGELVDDTAAGARIRYQPINACIQFLPTLDGKLLLTVEDLKGAGGNGAAPALNPVQQAMVACHGSQCGFCTPGFVMSLYALYRTEPAPDRRAIDDALAGNLCRCTGYGPIVAAARRMYEEAGPDRIAAREAEHVAMLRELAGDGALEYKAGGQRYVAPRSADALADVLERYPDAALLAGGTDLALRVTKGLAAIPVLVYTGAVADLRRIRERDGMLEIGATVTYGEAHNTLAARFPDLGELIRRLGSTQIRACATIAGNIANGSPIGDSPPPLIALGAEIELRRGAATRRLPLEDFFLAYGRQDRAPGEFLATIHIPWGNPKPLFACYKVSKRFDQDISAVCGAFALRLDGARVMGARIAYGGMAATPKRARAAERALISKTWGEPAIERAIRALDEDFAPISDMRASAAYRMTIARNLLRRFWLETGGTEAPTRVIGVRAAALEASAQ